MLKIFTPRDRGAAQFCDRVSRRNFLKIGGLGTTSAGLGLSLPQLLALEAQAGVV